MPRYRFNWSNLDHRLLRGLGESLRLAGDPVVALRSGYGARPRVEFVRDAWPALLEHWLSSDRRAAKRVAASLRQRGVGDTAVSDDFRFLSSVRNTSGMRQVVLAAFIEHGEQSSDDRELVRSLSIDAPARPAARPSAEVGQPDVDTAAPADDEDEVMEEGDEEELTDAMRLMMFLIEALVLHLDVEIEVDKDGDLAIPSGSAMVYVSVLEEPFMVRVFSPMVMNVPLSYELLTLLNGLNSKLPFGRFLHTNDVVFLEHGLIPSGLSVDEVVVVVNTIRAAADRFDHQIRERFGGDIAMLERAEDEIDV